MRISAKSEYAIKAVLDLAMRPALSLVPIQEIAARQAIPQRYLEQVLLALKRAGLVRSRRGSAGGYHLTRPPEAITVGDVLRAVEGASTFEALGGRKPSRNGHELEELWNEIAGAVSSVVDRLTFADLASRAAEHARAGRMMYHI